MRKRKRSSGGEKRVAAISAICRTGRYGQSSGVLPALKARSRGLSVQEISDFIEEQTEGLVIYSSN
jgi:hypothetical protein